MSALDFVAEPTTWDLHWLEEAIFVARKSKDRSRQVGAVVVNEHHNRLTGGWNGFPRGVDDNIEHRHARPLKYKYTEHAERNSIYNAAAEGVKLRGGHMYLALFPCSDCARGIIQAGIKTVTTFMYDPEDPTYGEDWLIAEEMMLESGVHVRILPGTAQAQKAL